MPSITACIVSYSPVTIQMAGDLMISDKADAAPWYYTSFFPICQGDVSTSPTDQ